MFFKKLLVPTDLSEPAEGALDAALSLVAEQTAQITLAHVIDLSMLLPTSTLFMTPGQELSLRGEVRDKVQESLATMAKDKAQVGTEIDTLVLEDKSVADALCHYAQEHGYDAIVISSHGRTGLAHLLIGSVAERVVRLAKLPVLVVPTL